ncbi:hypothetical protein [Kitasatospora aureofaciens]|uniref:hypothetical protein n=1 Tax=Kitasatospora aureofaciens TaxID=1894 RepID=UPI000527762B|nr:hypothetical protein [Kitasatospora aureofaciens]
MHHGEQEHAVVGVDDDRAADEQARSVQAANVQAADVQDRAAQVRAAGATQLLHKASASRRTRWGSGRGGWRP